MPITPEQAQAEIARRAAESSSGITAEQARAEILRRQGGAKIVEEMHPRFTDIDRFAIKNFSNDAEGAKAFLQKKYPDLEVKTDPNSGRLIAKSADEQEYRVLDPDTGFFSNPAEMLRDTGDIASDVGAAIGTTAATAGAGLFGAFGGGVGAVPAAMAGGAASSAALEALRQKIGVGLGLNEEVNTGDVALAGGFGAASPLLFGTGATATQVALKNAGKGVAALNPFAGAGTALKEGFSTAAESAAGKGLFGGSKAAVGGFLRGIADQPALTEEGTALLSSQRGLVGRGYDAYRENIAPRLGAWGSGKNVEDIAFYRDNVDAVRALDGADMGAIGDGVRERAEGAYRAELTNAGQMLNEARAATEGVDISGAKKKFMEAIEAEEQKIGDLAASKTFQDRIGAMRQEYRNLFQMEIPNPNFDPEQAISATNPETIWTDLPDVLTGEQAWMIQQRAKELSGVEQYIRAGSYADRPLSQTEAKRALSFAAGDVSKQISDAIDLASDGAMSAANKRYATVKEARDILDNVIGDSVIDSTTRKLANLTNPTNAEKFAALKRADEILKTNFAREAQLLAASKAFGKNADYFAGSSRGVTATLRGAPAAVAGGSLGYYLGAQSGLGQGGAGLGLAGGTLLGAGIGGPMGLKAYMAMQRGATTAGRALENVGVKAPVIPFSAWTMMNNAGTGQ